MKSERRKKNYTHTQIDLANKQNERQNRRRRQRRMSVIIIKWNR